MSRLLPVGHAADEIWSALSYHTKAAAGLPAGMQDIASLFLETSVQGHTNLKGSSYVFDRQYWCFPVVALVLKWGLTIAVKLASSFWK